MHVVYVLWYVGLGALCVSLMSSVFCVGFLDHELYVLSGPLFYVLLSTYIHLLLDRTCNYVVNLLSQRTSVTIGLRTFTSALATAH